MLGLLTICLVTAGYTLIAKRLSATIVTAPMIFIALGAVFSVVDLDPSTDSRASLHLVAEIALVVLLFLDAAQIDPMALRARHLWPTRMLLIGLPLTVALGTVAGVFFLPGWPLVAVALVAAILAPTDAALGQAVTMNSNVPVRVRRALTVESGLNDGLALPAVLFFASMTAATTQSGGEWILFGAKQILLGPLAGICVGALGGWALLLAKRHDTTSDIYEGIGALAIAGAAYLGAESIGGNGFIAAFVAGLFFGGIVKGACKFVYEFTESEGQLLAWASFFLIGAALVPDAIADLTWPIFALILISLLVVRPIAIWISLLGSDASPMTRLLFGWFGPRGLATALFALLVFESIPSVFGDQIINIAINAVWISALLHGITAAPLAKLYSAMIARVGECPETKDIASLP